MDDTPEHIKQLRREIWASKSPEEKLRIVNQLNEDILKICNRLRKGMGLPEVDKIGQPLTVDNYIV